VNSPLGEAIRLAATNPKPDLVTALAELLRSGATVGLGEEPAVVQALYRRNAAAVLPVLLEYGDGAPFVAEAARLYRAAAVEILLRHAAEPVRAHVTRLSPERYLVRGGLEYFARWARLILAATVDDGSPGMDIRRAWVSGESGDLLARLKEKLEPSSYDPAERLLVLDDLDLAMVREAADCFSPAYDDVTRDVAPLVKRGK
jgi:hypothetical protein